tara:strand:- start:649 stop:1560 length:912 start_codon:yes stop_codon:yes gene_type:complete
MNRADYLERVYLSLLNQNFDDFEWIVGDDGSTDSTIEILKKLKKNAPFDIKIVSASVRIGKTTIDNKMIEWSEGKYIIFCDSDDWLEHDALFKFYESTKKFPNENTIGCFALQKNNLLKKEYFRDNIPNPIKLIDLFYIEKPKQDLVMMTRSDYLKKNKYFECDFLIPEGYYWLLLENKKFVLINEFLQNTEYMSNENISFSNTISYSRGKAYNILFSYNKIKFSFKIIDKYKYFLTFIRFSIHGEIVNEIFNKKFNFLTRLSLILLFPIGYLYAMSDHFRFKVIKTHKEYEKARDVVSFEYL